MDFFQSDELQRLADLRTLGNELWCHKYNLPLSLRHIIDEKKCGVASIFTATCIYCQSFYEVNSNYKREGVKEYPINLRVVSGMLCKILPTP